jgi:iron complex outermembrane receptor protein
MEVSRNNIQINSVGYAPNSFFCLSSCTILTKTNTGAYVVSEDGKIDAEDRYRFHKSAPDYTLVLFSTLNYKNLTLQ